MHILINASNLKKGGGIQVADSLLHEFALHTEHQFMLVVSTPLYSVAEQLAKTCAHLSVFRYDLPGRVITAVSGRDKTLDNLVKEQHIDVVFTVFGPSRWIPKVPHLCGFARSQICLPESPFWKKNRGIAKIKSDLRRKILTWLFRQSARFLWTENSFITDRMKLIYPNKEIYTVTNTYNQIFDSPEKWNNTTTLPSFNGFTLLTVSANYPHKNLEIIRPCIVWLRESHPDFNFRFVLTLNTEQYPPITEEEKKHLLLIGPVSIAQVPNLYKQADALFLPTLLECFSASYAEAMRMKTPILTSNLGFAHSLCNDAASYFNPINPSDIGKKIYELATNPSLKESLVEKGEKQLLSFDNAKTRANKLIHILETIYNKK